MFFAGLVYTRWIEIEKVAKAEAESVANLAVGLAELRHHPLAHLHVCLIFDRSHPEPKQVSAPLFADFGGLDGVAERLGHGAALFVESPAMGDDCSVRSVLPGGDADEQRTVEPAAVLVGAFEVNVRGPFVAFQHGQVRRSRVEPNIENVIFLAPLGGTAFALRAGGKKFLRCVFVPSVGTFFFKPLDDITQGPEIFEALPASVAIKNDDGHAPEALARHAPVGAVFNHFV